MELADGERASLTPHGAVVYRYRHGSLVAVLPLTCRRGEHSLYGHYRTREHENLLIITCARCHAHRRPHEAWLLYTGGRVPARAELDDAPYAEIRATQSLVDPPAWLVEQQWWREFLGHPF